MKDREDNQKQYNDDGTDSQTAEDTIEISQPHIAQDKASQHNGME